MTQRLSMKSDDELDGLAKEILESSNQFMGRTSNLTRTLLTHSPMLARWFLGLVASVRQPSLGATTDVRLRNLATIKTSMTNECKYCTSHTSIFGQSMGLTDEQLAAMQDDTYKTSPLFDERERAVIAWAQAMTLNKAARDQPLWNTMRELFSEQEIVEISLASSMFDMINRLNDSLWTELEPVEFNRLQGNALKGRSVAQLEDYAGRFAAAGQRDRERGEAHATAAE